MDLISKNTYYHMPHGSAGDEMMGAGLALIREENARRAQFVERVRAVHRLPEVASWTILFGSVRQGPVVLHRAKNIVFHATEAEFSALMKAGPGLFRWDRLKGRAPEEACFDVAFRVNSAEGRALANLAPDLKPYLPGPVQHLATGYAMRLTPNEHERAPRYRVLPGNGFLLEVLPGLAAWEAIIERAGGLLIPRAEAAALLETAA